MAFCTKCAVGAAAVGGGILAAWWAWRRAGKVEAAVREAVREPPAGAPPKPRPILAVRLTTYYPLAAKTEAERKMEGGLKDRRGKPLHFLEDHLADPQQHPYVSVSGDDAAWPYGQRIALDAWPGAVFRVVDTGRNFRGSTKVYRATGREPLDIAVRSKATKAPTEATATIFPGDHLDKPGREIASERFRGQEGVVGAAPHGMIGLDLLGAS